MTERQQLEQAVAALEAQRATLGDAVVDAAITGLHQQIDALEQAELPAGPALEGERKLVTVMFADIAGFTALAEALDPEAVRDLMNACFERLVPIVEKYGGTVDKFIGDGLMVLFGAPVAHENDPERALRTALEMGDALAAFNAERGTDLGLHVGVNTGMVIAGGIGTRDRQSYSVMGDAVNLAKRLEEVAVRGQILVGPDTYRLTRPMFEFEQLEPTQVKGKSDLVPVYHLLVAKTIPGKMRGIAGLESPLVGRQSELRSLQAAVEQLPAGGGIVTLVGEAGLGKSRLVAEVRGSGSQPTEAGGQVSLQAAPPYTWVEGRCLSYGASIAYLLWVEITRALLGVTVEDPPLTVRDALRERVQALCPEQAHDVYPYLARILSIPLERKEDAFLHKLDGEQLKAATFQAMERFLARTSQRQPLIVVCEDLHWADSISIELLIYLFALTERVPLLFVCVFRPERGHRCWRIRETAIGLYQHRHTDLWLSPLSGTESAALVGHLLRVEDLPLQLRERILEHAEGNPFYVEEIIRSLIDSGTIVYQEATGRWVGTRDVADFTIPDTLQGVLMARIDQLQEETKRVLQLASVIGRIFLYRILAAIAQESRQLDGHLLTLQREQMIRERARMPELEYIFKHHLTQEAAYNGLLKKDRRAFHHDVAEALERLFSERIEEQVGLLAYHWERAEEADQAIDYLLRAGDQARRAHAHEEAIDYYQRALALLKERRAHAQAARTLMKLGLTYHAAFDFRHSRQAFEEGCALWQRAAEAEPTTQLAPAPRPLRQALTEPSTLDPNRVGDDYSAASVNILFGGLLEVGPQGEVIPGIAQSWDVLEEGRRYVLHLRDNLRWSDGSPLTASDFWFSWLRVLDPATDSPSASLLYDIKGARDFHQGRTSDRNDVGVRALDDVTLVVELEGPSSYFLYLLAHTATYPIPQHALERYGEAWTEVDKIVSNGAFTLEEWRPGASIVFVRNPHYYGRFRGNVQCVETTLLTGDPTVTLEMYERGQLDSFFFWGLAQEDWDRARQRHAGEYFTFPQLFTSYIGFDVSRPPFDDVRVRQAFAMALNKEALADVVMKGRVFPATGGFVPPGMPGHVPGIGLPYDPERARQLLAEAGYPGGQGFPAVEALTRFRGREPQRDYLRLQWQENLGLEIPWDVLEYRAFADRLFQDPPHISLIGWVADYPDPDNFLRASPIRRNTRWQDETYDRLVEQARRITDQGERMRLYEQAERILAEQVAIISLIYWRGHALVKPWLRSAPGRWRDIIIQPR